MDKLSNELLRCILDHIEADPTITVSIDRRAYLSVESFNPPPPPLASEAENISNFRLVCKRFGDVGIPHQFTRITTRFSKKGFQRLERIAEKDYLAKHVKKFTYMLPFFYQEMRLTKELIEQLLQQFGGDIFPLDGGSILERARQQRDIIETALDAKILTKAFTAFTSLQHVQLLRLLDVRDQHLLDYIRYRPNPSLLLTWTPACVHGTRTIGQALLESRSSCTRFSGPMMNPQSALCLQKFSPLESPNQKISSLAERLTCLEIHFDEHVDLDNRMRELTGLFKTVFSTARGMLAVHVGFPTRAPIHLKLEDIFHNVQWEKLRAFGIQSWRLDAGEIIALARRHRKTLRGLRLRDVLLKKGSLWKDVLAMLREEMELLDWVSLRRIGYSEQFDLQYAGTGEVPPDTPFGASDSDEEYDSDWNNYGDEPNDLEPDEQHDSPDFNNNDLNEEYEENDESMSQDDNDEDDDHGPEANGLYLYPDTPVSTCQCNCGARESSFPDSADALGDTSGERISSSKRKLWEQWVIGKCPEHDRS
ncbi:MAG: hypothetical protein M1829_005802 [Trizodia sp. TS-e1964]|nr:MAG: hypothetical protein M1829_005802 [Trizodia sp. TS-e1964]